MTLRAVARTIAGLAVLCALFFVRANPAAAATVTNSSFFTCVFDFAPSTPIGSPFGMLNSASGYTLNPRPKISFWSVDPNGQMIKAAWVQFSNNSLFNAPEVTYTSGLYPASFTTFPVTSGTTIYFTSPDDWGPGIFYVRVAVQESYPGTLWSEYRNFQIDFRSAASFWTDPTISTGSTLIRAAHLSDLRAAVSNAWMFRGLGAPSWTDATLSTGTTMIRPVHITELRTKVDQAITAAGLTPAAWTDPTISAGATLIRVIHLMELRSAAQRP